MGAFDDLIPKSGGTSGGAFDDLIPKQTKATPIPQKTQEDFLREAAAEMDWGTRNIASAGLQISKGLEGLRTLFSDTPADKDVVQAADVASDVAPVGAMVGEVAKYAPTLAVPGGVLAQALAAGTLGAAYDTSGKRISSGVLEGVMGAAGAGAGKLLPKVANKGAEYYTRAREMLGGAPAEKFGGSLDRAREVLQKLMGDKISESADVLRGAGDVTTAQALADIPDVGRRMAVLDEIAKSRQGIEAAADPLAAEAFRANQAIRQQEAMRSIMEQGGASSELARLNQDFLSKQAAAELSPVKMKLLDDLAASGKQLDELLPLLNETERRYILALRNQGQMATEAGAAISPVTGRGQLVPNPQTTPLQGERLSTMVRSTGGQPKAIDEAGFQQFQNAASQFGDVASLLRSEADALRQQITEASKGAFTAQPIRDLVSAAVSNPANQLNPIKRTVLAKVKDSLEVVGNDPALLAEFRKIGVNDLLGELAAGVDKTTKKAAEAELMSIKAAIDKQLGDEFITKYMEPYSKKLAYVDSMKAMDELRLMQKESPDTFLKTIRGDNPDFMDAYSMTANSLKEMLGDSRFGQVSGVAKAMQRDINLKTMASDEAATAAIKDVLDNKSWMNHRVNLLNRYVVLANTAIQGAEMQVNKGMYREIEKAMRDPKAMLRLIEMLPPAQRNEMIKYATELGKKGSVIGAAYGEDIRQ